MHNLRTRALVFAPFFALAAFAPLSAYATTYIISGSTDLVKTSSPVDSAFGYTMSTNVTVPASVTPNTSYTITISGTAIGSSAGLWCDNSGGGHTSCGGANAQGYAQKAGSGPIIQGSGSASGNVTSGASGSDTINVWMDVWASNGWGCNNWGGACSVPAITGNTVPVSIVAASPTVNVYFQ